MKRNLVSVALLGFAGAACAQSSVTLYGVADGWVGQTRSKAGTAASISTTVAESDGLSASRWGLRGSEDLGGGLRASFVLEQAITIDNGAVKTVSASNIGFNRAAYISLSGGFGEVRLGRMLGAFDALRGPFNQLYDASGFASTGTVWGLGTTASGAQAAVTGSDYLARGNNTLLYSTPVFSGFSGSISYSAAEGMSTATAAPRSISSHAKYVKGPLKIGYGYQAEHYTTGNNTFKLASGAYDWGVARVVASIQRQDDTRIAGGQSANEWQAGVDVPFGQAIVAVGYASSKVKNAAGVEVADARGLSLMGIYSLTKRTRLYAALRQVDVKRADGSTSTEASRYGVGISHTF